VSHRSAFCVTLLSTLLPALASAQDASVQLSTESASASGSGSVNAETSRSEPGPGKIQNTLGATSGLLRTVAADADAAGTFRFSVIGSYFTGSGFLCPTCALPDGTVREGSDDVVQIGSRLGLSFTPVDFLEGYAGLRYQSTENSLGDPAVMHVVGDSLLGLKAFLPRKTDRIYGFGGAAEVLTTNSAGGVGVDAVSARLRGLATLDLTDRSDLSERIPLRAHLNLSYFLDNSGRLADRVEADRGSVIGESATLTRIERFGHDINRFDALGVSLGAEVPLNIVHPFAEWSIEVPVNRRGYSCNVDALSAGDTCMAGEGFSALPSRATLGARVFPWFDDWTRGLALLAAVDIGTGATRRFVDELAPQAPWMVHIGLGYGFDTRPRIEEREVERLVQLPPPPERLVMGRVLRANTEEPVAGALVRFAGQDVTGMVTTTEGRFDTQSLAPGSYSFTVEAPGFADGACSVDLPEASEDGGPRVTAWVECRIEALPDAANIDGTVRDAESTVPVAGASIRILDSLGRSLTLATDEQGAFRFENVKSGTTTLSVEAPGYLPARHEHVVEARRDGVVRLHLHAEPKQSKVVLTDTELKIKEQVQFLHGSAEIGPDSEGLIQEIAQVLRSHPEILAVEVQGHTDDSGTAAFNQDLSQRRAEAVRAALIRNGIDESRLVARGYGLEKPLVPNTSDVNRARNRRVQFVIAKRE
jgi:outer membrane protein OmpA-like peptidoglycan-associated protein